MPEPIADHRNQSRVATLAALVVGLLLMLLLASTRAAFASPQQAPGNPPVNGQWTSLGPGSSLPNSQVAGIAVEASAIYAVGNFDNAGGYASADAIAQYDGTEWGPIGTQDFVNGADVVKVNGGVIYAGGDFFFPSSGPVEAGLLAQFNGGTWQQVGPGDFDAQGTVFDIEFDGATMYIGGAGQNIGGDNSADLIAQLSGGVWSALGGINMQLTSGYVSDIEIVGSAIYIAGSFQNLAGDADIDHVARFESGAWHPVGNGGLNNVVQDILIDGSDIYIAGWFTDAGGDANADKVARLGSGGDWEALSANPAINGNVYTMVQWNDDIIIGGLFTDAGGDADADYVAKYNTVTDVWSSLGGIGTGLSDNVFYLELVGNTLYAGGAFLDAGGDSEGDRIAQYGLTAYTPAATATPTGIPTATPIPGGSATQPRIATIDITAGEDSVLQLGRMWVSVPGGALPSTESNCQLRIQELGDSGEFGFDLDDLVWDVSIHCSSGEQTIFFAPITICIQPEDGQVGGKQVFHRHSAGSEFNVLGKVDIKAGYVCGQTRVLSLFTLGAFGLPATGFAPDSKFASVAEDRYANTGLSLSIPQLGIQTSILGVPQSSHGWDVSWLGDNAGFLAGSAFPTLPGNTVITAHVWGADNRPGPFAGLSHLKYGDRFTIYAWGQSYTYEVRSNDVYSPASIDPLQQEVYDWVTLLTCEGFDKASGQYRFRRAVRAVLVAVD